MVDTAVRGLAGDVDTLPWRSSLHGFVSLWKASPSQPLPPPPVFSFFHPNPTVEPFALLWFSDAFEQRLVSKRYVALVAGELEGSGAIVTPLDGKVRNLHVDN